MRKKLSERRKFILINPQNTLPFRSFLRDNVNWIVFPIFGNGLLQFKTMRRVKRMIVASTIMCISLFAFTSCEEESEIFDHVDLEIEQQTDDEDLKKSSPGG